MNSLIDLNVEFLSEGFLAMLGDLIGGSGLLGMGFKLLDITPSLIYCLGDVSFTAAIFLAAEASGSSCITSSSSFLFL